MKRVLILGVNGFIGHHLSHRIMAETDWEVFGMDAWRMAYLLSGSFSAGAITMLVFQYIAAKAFSLHLF